MGILSKKANPDVDTLIGSSTVFEGKLSATGGIKIEGTVRGTIDCEGLLVVGVGGRIEADILAESAVVGGEVVGNITARDRLEIISQGRVQGDITTAHLIIEDGVVFEGSSHMITDESAGYPRIAKTEALPEAVGAQE